MFDSVILRVIFLSKAQIIRKSIIRNFCLSQVTPGVNLSPTGTSARYPDASPGSQGEESQVLLSVRLKVSTTGLWSLGTGLSSEVGCWPLKPEVQGSNTSPGRFSLLLTLC